LTQIWPPNVVPVQGLGFRNYSVSGTNSLRENLHFWKKKSFKMNLQMCNQALPSKFGSISSTWEHLEFILREQATWICLPSTLQVFYGFETCWNFLLYSLLLHIVLATCCIDACLYIGKLTYMSKIRLNTYTHKLCC